MKEVEEPRSLEEINREFGEVVSLLNLLYDGLEGNTYAVIDLQELSKALAPITRLMENLHKELTEYWEAQIVKD